MKIIFLDIDGVLNSVKYDATRTKKDGNIDKTRLVLLKKIVDATDAKIVLTSSWRKHWEKDEDKCDDAGKEINRDFAEYGLEIFDKTAFFMSFDRASEIRSWVNSHNNVERFVIIDDIFVGWGELHQYLVQTSALIGRGLEETHVQKAIGILNS